MTILRAAFERDLRVAVLRELPAERESRELLRRRSTADLLNAYFNWRQRFVTAAPRVVRLSSALETSGQRLNPRARAALQGLIGKIEAGEDLTPFLSRRVQTAVSRSHERTPLPHRAHLDTLLNGWGIHHLHLGRGGKPEPGSASRSRELLFVIFRPSEAFLLDVRDHHSFKDVDLLRIAVRTWPDAGLLWEARGFIGLAQDTTEQAGDLRDHGVAAFVEIDGKVYSPSDAITSAGTSLLASQRADQVMRAVAQLSEAATADKLYLSRFVGRPLPRDVIPRIVLRGERLYLNVGGIEFMWL